MGRSRETNQEALAVIKAIASGWLRWWWWSQEREKGFKIYFGGNLTELGGLWDVVGGVWEEKKGYFLAYITGWRVVPFNITKTGADQKLKYFFLSTLLAPSSKVTLLIQWWGLEKSTGWRVGRSRIFVQLLVWPQRIHDISLVSLQLWPSEGPPYSDWTGLFCMGLGFLPTFSTTSRAPNSEEETLIPVAQ